jgi:hypothetical protein
MPPLFRLFMLPTRPVRRTARRGATIGAMLLAVSACTREPSEADRQAAHVQEVVAAGGVVDSVLPVAEALRRFRTDLPQTDTLLHASPSLDALVQRIARSVGSRDTADLNAMVMSRAEFAWLYYESSPMSKPPYEAPPGLLWGQIMASSDVGAKALLARFAGVTVTPRQRHCPAAEVEGANRLYKRCTVELTAPGKASMTGNLFGTVLERDGRFKLISFANRI